MKRYPLSDHFYLDELVPPEMLYHFGEAARWFVRPQVIDVLEGLRRRFGPVTVNNWSQWGKVSPGQFLLFPLEQKQKYFTQSGLRQFFVIDQDGELIKNPTGADFSMHKYGLAADAKLKNATADEVRRDIQKHFHSTYKPLGLTTIEANTKGWLHLDCRNTNQDELLIVYP